MYSQQRNMTIEKSLAPKQCGVMHFLLHRIATHLVITITLASLMTAAEAVNLANMSANIDADLQGNVNGYAFVVEDDNESIEGAGGFALRAGDSDNGIAVPMTTSTRSFIASVTKNITAIATLQLLDKNVLPVNALIEPWLPADWVRGPNIDQITFKDLLQHKTGFKQIYLELSEAKQDNWGNDYAGLKWIVENGALLNAPARYHNSNFALLRVLIPALINGHQAPAPNQFLLQLANGIVFADYAIHNIFEPSGVSPGATCSASDYYQDQAMAYDFNDPDEAGHMSESNPVHCGGHAGLRMSARDLIQVLAGLQGGYILSAEYLDQMYSEKLGWSSASNTQSSDRQGKWWHSGTWKPGSGRRYHACVMIYPDGVRASVVVNSSIQGKSACTVLKDAYNNAEQ